MNNEEFKSSKSESEEESQPSSQNVESSINESEPHPRSSSSELATFDLPSFSSSGDVNGSSRNETDERSSEDEPEFVPQEPMPLSVSRVVTPERISPSVSHILRKLIVLATKDVAYEQDCHLEFLRACSNREIEQLINPFHTSGDSMRRNLVSRFWGMVREILENQSQHYTLVTTGRARSFWEEVVRRVPFEIPADILYRVNIPSSTFTGLPYRMVNVSSPRNRPSTPALQNISSTSLRDRSPTPALQNISSTSLCDRPSTRALKMVPRNISVEKRNLKKVSREIFPTSEPEASPGLCDSQPSSSKSENEIHKSEIKLEHFKPGEHYVETEPWSAELLDALKAYNWIPPGILREPHFSERKSKNEREADAPILGEESLPHEEVERILADALQEPPDVSQEDSSEKSPEGSPIKKSESHFK